MNTNAKTFRDRRRFTRLVATGSALCLALILSGCSAGAGAKVAISDEDISAGVSAGLSADPRLSIYEIGVVTESGVVRLDGSVPKPGDRDDAEKIARNSQGVVRVDNYIRFGGEEFDTE
jgi:osmotically-inducible protein OsmY